MHPKQEYIFFSQLNHFLSTIYVYNNYCHKEKRNCNFSFLLYFILLFSFFHTAILNCLALRIFPKKQAAGAYAPALLLLILSYFITIIRCSFINFFNFNLVTVIIIYFNICLFSDFFAKYCSPKR